MLTTSRTWVAGTVVAALLLAVAVWFLAISPQRAEAAETREQTLAAEDMNAQLAARLGQLEQQFLDLPAKEAELAAVKAAMPDDDAIPTLIRLLDGYAADTGVTLMSLAPGQAVVPAADPAATPAPAADGTMPAAPAADATPGGLVTVEIPLTTTVVGDYFEVKAFLERVQTGTRAHLVTNLSLTPEAPAEAAGGKPATTDGDVTMTITGSVFALRDVAVVDQPTGTTVPGAAPAAPAEGAAPTAVAS